MNTIEKPATEIEVTIQDGKYTVKYPKSGEMIEIAVLKAKLSDNQYGYLFYQNSKEANISIRLIDAYSFFTIMLPDLKEGLAKKSLYDLETLEAIELIHVYDNIISPWMDQWTEIINNRIEELKGTSNKNSKREMI